MRPIINLLSSLYLSLRYGAWTIMLFLVFGLSSCFKLYYQTNTVPQTDEQSLQKLLSQDKHFVVHSSGTFFALKNVHLTGNTLSAQRDSLNPKYDNFLNPPGENANPVRRKYKNICFEEVHLYTNTFIGEKDSVSLPIAQIHRIDVYSPDRKAIKDSRVSSIIGITIGAVALVGLGFYIASSIVVF